MALFLGLFLLSRDGRSSHQPLMIIKNSVTWGLINKESSAQGDGTGLFWWVCYVWLGFMDSTIRLYTIRCAFVDFRAKLVCVGGLEYLGHYAK